MSEFWDLHTDFSKEQKVQNQMEKRDCIPMVQEVGGHQAKKLFFFCVYVCSYMCACMCGEQRPTSDVLQETYSVFGTSSLIGLEFAHWSWLAGQQAQEICFSVSLVLGLQPHHLAWLFFNTCILEIKLRSLYLHGQHLTYWESP